MGALDVHPVIQPEQRDAFSCNDGDPVPQRIETRRELGVFRFHILRRSSGGRREKRRCHELPVSRLHWHGIGRQAQRTSKLTKSSWLLQVVGSCGAYRPLTRSIVMGAWPGSWSWVVPSRGEWEKTAMMLGQGRPSWMVRRAVRPEGSPKVWVGRGRSNGPVCLTMSYSVPYVGCFSPAQLRCDGGARRVGSYYTCLEVVVVDSSVPCPTRASLNCVRRESNCPAARWPGKVRQLTENDARRTSSHLESEGQVDV